MPDVDPTVVSDAALRARIAQIVEVAQPHKRDVWNSISGSPLVNLVVGFLLTGVLGGLVANAYQSRQEAHRKAAEVRDDLRHARLSLLDSLGLLINVGYYDYGRYYDAIDGRLRQKTPRDTLVARRSLFDAFNDTFERHELLDAARVCSLFGQDLLESYTRLSAAFHFLNPHIRRFANSPSDSAAAAVSHELYLLRDSVFAFALAMVSATRDTASFNKSSTSGCHLPAPPQ